MNDKLKDQALECCIDIYEKFDKDDLWNCSLLTLRAWKIGKRATSINNKVFEDGQASFCGNWTECDFPGYRKCNKQCGNYTPAT